MMAPGVPVQIMMRDGNSANGAEGLFVGAPGGVAFKIASG